MTKDLPATVTASGSVTGTLAAHSPPLPTEQLGGPGVTWDAGPMSPTSFPALDFPLYGLADWQGSSWLDVIEGEIGKPT